MLKPSGEGVADGLTQAEGMREQQTLAQSPQEDSLGKAPRVTSPPTIKGNG